MVSGDGRLNLCSSSTVHKVKLSALQIDFVKDHFIIDIFIVYQFNYPMFLCLEWKHTISYGQKLSQNSSKPDKNVNATPPPTYAHISPIVVSKWQVPINQGHNPRNTDQIVAALTKLSLLCSNQCANVKVGFRRKTAFSGIPFTGSVL